MTIDQREPTELWRNAQTIDEIGELTAQWIEGKLRYHPCYGESVDSETTSLISTLAKYNRQGLVTTFSQPAKPLDDNGCGQRACLEGYAYESLARRIAALGLYTDLLVFIFEPGLCGGYRIPVTVDEFHPFTWCGGSWGFEELEGFEEVCGAKAMSLLKSAWKVAVIDLRWGRKAHLWELVAEALERSNNLDAPYSITPAPHLGLDVDFVC